MSGRTRRRVLIVEKELSLQAAYRRYFRDRYRLVFAATGGAALRQCASFAPDVVVMDVHLPDADGIEVLRQMRSMLPALPAVITAGDPGLLPVLDALAIARSSCLMKPFELDTLRACIDAAS